MRIFYRSTLFIKIAKELDANRTSRQTELASQGNASRFKPDHRWRTPVCARSDRNPSRSNAQLGQDAKLPPRCRQEARCSMARVFISHSHQDKATARTVAQYLEANSTRVWLDENEILVGDSIPGRIEQGIADSDFVVVLLSKDSVTSGWVKREVETKLVDGDYRRERLLCLACFVNDRIAPGIFRLSWRTKGTPTFLAVSRLACWSC